MQRMIMTDTKFARLTKRGIITIEEWKRAARAAAASGKYPEEVLREAGVPKQELLFCLSEYYNCPFVEYDEGIILSRKAHRRGDGERLKSALWAPLSLDDALKRLKESCKGETFLAVRSSAEEVDDEGTATVYEGNVRGGLDRAAAASPRMEDLHEFRYFRFSGGATDMVKRSRRMQLVAVIARELGLSCMIKGDILIARISQLGQDEMEHLLTSIGRLTAYTRQLDAVLHADGAIQEYAERFLEETGCLQEAS